MLLVHMLHTRFCVWSISWNTTSASRAVSRSSRALKFRNNLAVQRRIANASDDSGCFELRQINHQQNNLNRLSGELGKNFRVIQ